MSAAGSAITANAFLLVELPLPWPKEITDHPSLAGVGAFGARVQGIVPSEVAAGTGQYGVTLYRRPSFPSVRYERRHVRGPIDALPAMLRDVADAPVDHSEGTEVLICTHGARDRCCGSLGTGLFFSAPRVAGVQLRRTSHLGGHRFAPTALLLPEGTAWAWLDEAKLAAILGRSGDVTDVIAHYRGSSALRAPVAQVAEREIFASVGWSWLDTPRRCEVVDRDPHRWTVRVESTIGVWRGVVERTGTCPQPACGVDLGGAAKTDDVLRLVELSEEV